MENMKGIITFLFNNTNGGNVELLKGSIWLAPSVMLYVIELISLKAETIVPPKQKIHQPTVT